MLVRELKNGIYDLFYDTFIIQLCVWVCDVHEEVKHSRLFCFCRTYVCNHSDILQWVVIILECGAVFKNSLFLKLLSLCLTSHYIFKGFTSELLIINGPQHYFGLSRKQKKIKNIHILILYYCHLKFRTFTLNLWHNNVMWPTSTTPNFECKDLGLMDWIRLFQAVSPNLSSLIYVLPILIWLSNYFRMATTIKSCNALAESITSHICSIYYIINGC